MFARHQLGFEVLKRNECGVYKTQYACCVQCQFFFSLVKKTKKIPIIITGEQPKVIFPFIVTSATYNKLSMNSERVDLFVIRGCEFCETCASINFGIHTEIGYLCRFLLFCFTVRYILKRIRISKTSIVSTKI